MDITLTYVSILSSLNNVSNILGHCKRFNKSLVNAWSCYAVYGRSYVLLPGSESSEI